MRHDVHSLCKYVKCKRVQCQNNFLTSAATMLKQCVCLCASAQTTEVMGEFSRLYEQQYAVALFNKVRFDIEGGGGPQPQLLHRKVQYPLLGPQIVQKIGNFFCNR